LVFHGGSGSSKDEIKTAVMNGVVKMNVDTGKAIYKGFLYCGG
jgi:fructose/tagatose bisphosphate aldolase